MQTSSQLFITCKIVSKAVYDIWNGTNRTFTTYAYLVVVYMGVKISVCTMIVFHTKTTWYWSFRAINIYKALIAPAFAWLTKSRVPCIITKEKSIWI